MLQEQLQQGVVPISLPIINESHFSGETGCTILSQLASNAGLIEMCERLALVKVTTSKIENKFCATLLCHRRYLHWPTTKQLMTHVKAKFIWKVGPCCDIALNWIDQRSLTPCN